METISKKIIDRNYIRRLSADLKKTGKKIVFTNGCFDLLHRGHVEYLGKAKALGDVLIVGVNTDESVRSNKGDDRPINILEDRMVVLSGLESVDYIVPFGEQKATQLIELIAPHVWAKGADYLKRGKEPSEAPVVRSLGGKVEYIEFVDNRSTTNIIKKISHIYGKKPIKESKTYFMHTS